MYIRNDQLQVILLGYVNATSPLFPYYKNTKKYLLITNIAIIVLVFLKLICQRSSLYAASRVCGQALLCNKLENILKQLLDSAP